MTTLVLNLEKMESGDETKYNMFYSNWNGETIMNESDINNVFESFNVTIMITNFIRWDITWIFSWLWFN